MKRVIFLFVFLLLLFVPVVVKAEDTTNISVTCDSDTLGAGQEMICKVIGSSDAEGKISLNQSGVTGLNLKVVLGNGISFVDKYGTANGWYLNGKFANNVNNYNLSVSNTSVTSTEIFTFKVKANSVGKETSASVNLSDVVITKGGQNQTYEAENKTVIKVTADPNYSEDKVDNPGTGDNMIYLIAAGGLITLSLGYVSFRKLKLK